MASELTMPIDALPAVVLRRAQERERSRRYRDRRDDGEMCVLLTLPRAELEDLLIDRGFLASHLADDREAVRNAVEAFVRAAILAGSED